MLLHLCVTQVKGGPPGPIVRIRPDVLHVNDPVFMDQLYPRNPASRREKYKTTLNVIQADTSTLGTKDHHLHRKRRAVVSPFFSMANVRRLEPVIQETFYDLQRRLEGWARAGVPAPMNYAYRAATKDIIHTYAFGSGEKCLEMEDLNEEFFAAIGPRPENMIGCYLYYVMAFFQTLPEWGIKLIIPRIVIFVHFVKISSRGGPQGALV